MSGEEPAVTFAGGGDVQVDAATLAGHLGLTQAQLRDGMREGSITARVERGEGEDAGRTRLTVFTPGCRLRMVVDQAGAVLSTDRVDFGDRPLPPGMRRG